jgi:hypothetical protein
MLASPSLTRDIQETYKKCQDLDQIIRSMGLNKDPICQDLDQIISNMKEDLPQQDLMGHPKELIDHFHRILVR